MLKEATHILQKYWGHQDFRPLQEDIIEKVLEQKDVLALLPTGGGKSLCFQIPALLKPGICIVVSPLVALMEDQVNALKAKGIKALALLGGTHYKEIDTLLDNCIYGNYKFLYISPERLQQELVQERIKQMDVNLVAVDEAHCISEWGHDFRPAYRSISILRELKPETNIIGLTASATEPVVKDIAEQLQLREPAILRKSFERKNIAYSVVDSQDKYYQLEKLMKEHQESAIIYVRTRRASVEVATFLTKQGIPSASFNGGLSKKEKSERLQEWLSGKKRVMAATSAFGMGIDKANVRSVVHMHLPDSIEAYFQEAGRAGRDGKPAKAIILTNETDIPFLKNQFLESLPDRDFIKLLYRKLVSYFGIAYGEGEASEFSFNFADFCKTYQLNAIKAYNGLRLLDRTSVLLLSEHFSKKSRIQFLLPHKQLLYYLDRNPSFDAVVKAILRTYGGIFDNRMEVDFQMLSSKTGISMAQMLKLLQQLKKEEVIEFDHQQHDARITFLVPREDDSTINRISPYIKLQNKNKQAKINAVVEYLRNDKECRSQQLLRYFGEKKTNPCGSCSVCAPFQQPLTRNGAKIIYKAIVVLLEREAVSSRQIAAQLPFAEDHIIKVLQLLVEKGILSTTANHLYKLKHL